MSQETHSRPGGGYGRQAPIRSSSDESGAAAAPAARGPTLPAQRRAASAWTSGRGPTDREHLPPPRRPPTDRANEPDKENQHRSGIVPARRLDRPAGLAYMEGNPPRPVNPDNQGAAIGRTPTRPTAQAADDISVALSGLGVRAGSRRTGRGQRTETDENAAQGIPTPIEALLERLSSMADVVADANKHAENAADVSNNAMARNKVLLEELRDVQRMEPDRIDAAALAIEERALLETGRAQRESDRATAEAEGATSEFWQAANKVEQAQDETMQIAAEQLVIRAAPSFALIIAEVRAASTQVAAHDAAARAAAGQTLQAARAAEALMEQLRRILARQTGGPPRQEVGQQTNRQRRDPPGAAGAA
ncbi:hypothetical protein EPUS_06471 [Endocarpon pusillum Z07020]|uniref:Uncharacterized protein n=1 Tax=Endocarpon pusillum (strain Z07020 / HMAS-L-300199) TaxID=1263415 RepID=U1GYG9_ENDPU|nr:uncharacterized protein EPUS_06471 [Endocarpon pusillum Z07020]ERF77191.1 hypothetical protein EPUS_06471 [Endocarpon pusillum Z07020]